LWNIFGILSELRRSQTTVVVDYTEVLAELALLRDQQFLHREADVVSVRQVFKNGAVLPGTSPFGREARDDEKKHARYSLAWRRSTDLLEAVAFLGRMFRMLPFNTDLLKEHRSFLKKIQSEVKKQKKKLKVDQVVQWVPPLLDYGSDDEKNESDAAAEKEDDDAVKLTLDVLCPLGAAACAPSSAEHGLVPNAEAPSWGKEGRARHFKDSNRAIRAVRKQYAKNVGEGKVSRNPTIQFPNERDNVSTTEILRKSRGDAVIKSTYEVVVEVLNDHCDRFEFAGWVYNLSEASEINPVPFLPSKKCK
jgi:hypothetical protein